MRTTKAPSSASRSWCPNSRRALARAIGVAKGDAAAAEAALIHGQSSFPEKRRATVHTNFAALNADDRRVTLVELMRDFPDEAEAAIAEWRAA
ncbi:MAG: hypothetical protein R3D34_17550 [Nitratireductor sp.]